MMLKLLASAQAVFEVRVAPTLGMNYPCRKLEKLGVLNIKRFVLPFNFLRYLSPPIVDPSPIQLLYRRAVE